MGSALLCVPTLKMAKKKALVVGLHVQKTHCVGAVGWVEGWT